MAIVEAIVAPFVVAIADALATVLNFYCLFVIGSNVCCSNALVSLLVSK